MQQNAVIGQGAVRNAGFDVVKGVACIAVVLIHYTFPGVLGAWIKAFCRFAVPFFFCVSGYFLFDFRSEKVDMESVVAKIKKLLFLFAWATLLYVFVYYCALYRNHGWLPFGTFLERYINASSLLYLFLCNTGLFNLGLWFISALIYCYGTVLLFFSTRKRLHLSWLVILPLLGLMIVTQEFAEVAGFKWNHIPIPGVKPIPYFQLSCCFLCRALPFFLAGTFLRAYSDAIKKWKCPNWILLLFATLGGVISACEYSLLGGRIAQFYMGSYLTALSLCLWAIRGGCANNFSKLAWMGRELSMLVYVMHIAVGIGVSRLAEACGGFRLTWYGWINPVLVVAGSIGVSVVLHKLGGLRKR